MFPTYEIVDFEKMDDTSSQWITRDAIFACAVLTINSIYVGPGSGGLRLSSSRSPRFYLLRTIALLNEKLSRGLGHLDPSSAHAVVYVVTILATVAAELGNYAEIGVHLTGLVKIFQLVGGRYSNGSERLVAFFFELERYVEFFLMNSAPLHDRGVVYRVLRPKPYTHGCLTDRKTRQARLAARIRHGERTLLHRF